MPLSVEGLKETLVTPSEKGNDVELRVGLSIGSTPKGERKSRVFRVVLHGLQFGERDRALCVEGAIGIADGISRLELFSHLVAYLLSGVISFMASVSCSCGYERRSEY